METRQIQKRCLGLAPIGLRWLPKREDFRLYIVATALSKVSQV